MVHLITSRLRVAMIATIALMAFPTIAAADASGSGGNSEAPTIPNSNPVEFLGSLVWVVVALAIVITLILLVIKWLSRRNQLWGANRSMRSLGGIALGQSSSMQVVEIAGRVYIVGVGETITLLDKWDDPEEAAAVIAALEKSPDQAWSPKDLTHMLKKWRKGASSQKEPGKEQWNSASSFQQMLQNKLEKGTNRKQQLEEMLQDDNKNERLMDHEK